MFKKSCGILSTLVQYYDLFEFLKAISFEKTMHFTKIKLFWGNFCENCGKKFGLLNIQGKTTTRIDGKKSAYLSGTVNFTKEFSIKGVFKGVYRAFKRRFSQKLQKKIYLRSKRTRSKPIKESYLQFFGIINFL